MLACDPCDLSPKMLNLHYEKSVSVCYAKISYCFITQFAIARFFLQWPIHACNVKLQFQWDAHSALYMRSMEGPWGYGQQKNCLVTEFTDVITSTKTS